MSPFDAYRDPPARELMIDFVMRSRAIDKLYAVSELRALNHVGLAHVYQDAIAAATRAGAATDYDPCQVGRM